MAVPPYRKVFSSVQEAGGEAVGADCPAHPTAQRPLCVKLSKSELDWYFSYKTLEIYTEQNAIFLRHSPKGCH